MRTQLLFASLLLLLNACGTEVAGPNHDGDSGRGDDSGGVEGGGASSGGQLSPTGPTARDTYRVRTGVSPANGGVVVREPADERLPAQTSLTIVAEPAAGFRLARWEGDAEGAATTIDVTLTADTEITAIFERIPVSIDAKASIPEAGVVDITPKKAMYAVGDVVTLTAPSSQSFALARWSTGSEDASITLTLTADTTITAIMLPVPQLDAPTQVTGPGSFALSYVLNWGSAPPPFKGSADTFIVEEASSPRGPFVQIHNGIVGNLVSRQVTVLNRGVGTYYYRVRAMTQAGMTPNSPMVRVDRVRAPSVLRIINDLPAGAPWNVWNQVIRLRVGNDINSAAAAPDRLSPVSPRASIGDTVMVGETQDFDVDAFSSRSSYYVFVQLGFWDNCIDTYGSCFEPHLTEVYACQGLSYVAPKYAVVIERSHAEGVRELRLSQFLPGYHYYQSSFCQ